MTSSKAAREPDDRLAEILGHRFRDPALLHLALTHPSAAYEEDGGGGNERLEFLGDAVLDMVVAQHLFRDRPGWREGKLTRARASLVNTKSLAARAREQDLGAYIRLGRTERQSQGAEKDRVLANLFEAVLGALYLDAGLEATVAFVERVFAEPLAAAEDAVARDPKTEFQEWSHREHRETPQYRLLGDTGVDAADDRFTVRVEIGGAVYGEGVGRTKRAAERVAATRALARVREDESDA